MDDDDDNDAAAHARLLHDKEEELLLLLMIETLERNRYHSSLTGAGQRNQSGEIRRSSLLPTQQSVFMQLFLSQEDDSMITMMRVLLWLLYLAA
jgi:hypothetical protein